MYNMINFDNLVTTRDSTTKSLIKTINDYIKSFPERPIGSNKVYLFQSMFLDDFIIIPSKKYFGLIADSFPDFKYCEKAITLQLENTPQDEIDKIMVHSARNNYSTIIKILLDNRDYPVVNNLYFLLKIAGKHGSEEVLELLLNRANDELILTDEILNCVMMNIMIGLEENLFLIKGLGSIIKILKQFRKKIQCLNDQSKRTLNADEDIGQETKRPKPDV